MTDPCDGLPPGSRARVLPRLDAEARDWLVDALGRVAPEHEWLDRVTATA